MNRIRTIALTLGVLAGVLSACSDDKGTSSPATGGSGGDATVVIKGFAFDVKGDAKAGVAFTIRNDDGTTHTFTNADGLFDVTVPAGGTATVTVASAGTYKAICKIHTSMSTNFTVG